MPSCGMCKPNLIADWVRQPVVSYNQAGYTPGRGKVAVIELDPNFKAPAQATLVKLTADGKPRAGPDRERSSRGANGCATATPPSISPASAMPGLYAISYAGHTTESVHDLGRRLRPHLAERRSTLIWPSRWIT